MAWNRDTTDIGISYDIVANDKTEAGTSSAVKNLAKVSAAFATLTAVSAGLLVASDRVNELNKVAARTAYTYKVPTEQFRAYAKELSDATTPIDEVLRGFDNLSRSGVKLADLKPIFKEFDEMGEALGMDADVVISQLTPALNALEIPLTDIAKYQDVFTHTVRNSNLELGEYANMVARLAPNLKALGLDVYDVSAIFAVMEKHGIVGRKAMMMMNEAISAQEKAEQDLAQSKEELIRLQEELNGLTADGTKLTREYLEDVKYAGRDAQQIRSLSRQYKRGMGDLEEKRSAKAAEVATAQSTVAAGAKPFDLIATLNQQTGGKVTKEEVQAQKDLLEGIKGETDARAEEVVKYVTASEKAQFALDGLNQTLGSQISPQLAEMLPYIAVISGGLSALSGVMSILTMMFGGAAAGGAAGTAGGAAGIGAAGLAGAGAAGLGLGALGVYGLEKADLLGLPTWMGGTGHGAVQQAGAAFGAKVVGAGKGFGDFMRGSGQQGSQDNSLNIQNLSLSKDYPLTSFLSDRELSLKRKQSGVRTP